MLFEELNLVTLTRWPLELPGLQQSLCQVQCSLNSCLGGLSSSSTCGGFVSAWFPPGDGYGEAAFWRRHLEVWKGQAFDFHLWVIPRKATMGRRCWCLSGDRCVL